MKKIIRYTLLTLLLVSVVFTIYFLFRSSAPKMLPTSYETLVKTNILKKTVAAGSIQPRKEVNIKSQVSGVVSKIYVTAGQYVTIGQTLATIRIIPSAARLNEAENVLNKARLNLEEAAKEAARYQRLYEDKVISEVEYNQYLIAFKRAKEDSAAAATNAQIVREGASAYVGASTIVKSTVNGMLLDVPVKEGSFVIESNTFNEGTTIAHIADINDMIFVGKVDESEVGKIKEGMNLGLTIGAIESKKFNARLEFISPKGQLEEGAIKFEIKAALELNKTDFIRAGYSANADIIFDRKDSVWAIKESVLQFAGDSTFVEVEGKDKKTEKRLVKLGLSDGIQVEVLSGISPGEKVKVPYNRGTEEKKWK